MWSVKMKNASEIYRAKALACEELGREVPNPDFKQAWSDIAIEWHALANRASQDHSAAGLFQPPPSWNTLASHSHPVPFPQCRMDRRR